MKIVNKKELMHVNSGEPTKSIAIRERACTFMVLRAGQRPFTGPILENSSLKLICHFFMSRVCGLSPFLFCHPLITPEINGRAIST